MPDRSLIQDLGQQIFDITAGHPKEETLRAQADAMATSVGGISYLSGMSIAEAKQTIQLLSQGMMRHLVDNWGKIDRGDH